jgi:hypothetical protein
MIGGDDRSSSTITLRDACDFMHKYYVPERAVVIVAGGVVVADAVKSIEHWFNVLDKRAPAPRRPVESFAVTRERKTFELDIERPWITVAWPLPDGRTPEGEAAAFGVWRAFFDTATKADEYECATQSFPTMLGGRKRVVLIARAFRYEQADQSDSSEGGEQRTTAGTAAVDAARRGQASAAAGIHLEPRAAVRGANQMGDLVQFSRD